MQLPGAAAQETGGLLTADLLRNLLHYKWKIAGLGLVGALIGLLVGYAQPPTYQSAATVLIEPRENRPVQVQQVYDPGVQTDTYLLTQIQILRSREIAGKVIDRLDLTNNREFNEPQRNSILDYWAEKASNFTLANLLPWLPAEQASESAPNIGADKGEAAQLRERVIDKLSAQTYATAYPRTQLIRVSYNSGSPVLAASVTNALADAYIEYGLDARLEMSKKATHWLNEKLADIRGTLEKSEKGLQEFREKQRIVDVGGARSLVDEELLDNSRRLREAKKQRTDLASTYTKIQQAGIDVRQLEQIGDLLRLPLVQSAKSNLLAALETLKEAQQRYGEKHPQYASTMTKVEAAERTFRDQLLLAAQNVRNQYEIARDSERTLSETVDSEKEQIRDLDRKAYEQGVLEREVASNKQLYDTFLTSFKQTDTASSFEPVSVRILEFAVAPERPILPNLRQYTLNGALIALLLGVVLLTLGQALDESVRSPDEIESTTALPVLSVVPKASAGIAGRKNLPALFIDHPRTPFAEGIRTIHASLKLNDVDKAYKRILVTSTVAGEGKSSLASCVGLAFCPAEKVLLIDADLRAPSIKRMFHMPKEHPGVMELLTGEATLEQCLFVHEPSQLHVLPVSKTPPNPAEVIQSVAFARLIVSLAERFDRIILDSPPCLAASDALVLAKIADVVVFTIKADSTRRRAVFAALKQLRQIQAHVVGTVLNQVDAYKNPNYADTYFYARQYYG